jgi:hypothetical protein
MWAQRIGNAARHIARLATEERSEAGAGVNDGHGLVSRDA